MLFKYYKVIKSSVNIQLQLRENYIPAKLHCVTQWVANGKMQCFNVKKRACCIVKFWQDAMCC